MRVYEYSKLKIGDRGDPGVSDSDVRELEDINEEMRKNGIINTHLFRWTGKDSIQFRNYAGFISLNNKSIEILPKIFRPYGNFPQNLDTAFDSFVKMLSYVMEIELNKYKEDYQIMREQKVGLLDIVIFFFVVSLKKAIKKGLLYKYEQQDVVSPYLNGKIILERQLASIDQTKLLQETYIHTSNTNLMRYFKTAISFFADLTMKRFLKEELKKLSKHFGDTEFLPRHQLKSMYFSFDRLNAYLENAFLQSKLILNGVSYSSSRDSKVKGVSILFDMNHIFEDFITKLIKRNSTSIFSIGKPPKIISQTGSKWLFSNNKQKILRPDIQIIGRFSGNDELQIIDTKYIELDGKDIINEGKHNPISRDLYQMFAYSTKYNSKNTVVLYPSTRSGCKYRNAFSPNRNFMLWGININLTQINWEKNIVDDLQCVIASFYDTELCQNCI